MQLRYAQSFAGMIECMYSSAMSLARHAAERSYKNLKQNFASKILLRQLRVQKAPTAFMYRASAVLWTIKVCMKRGGDVYIYFRCPTPPFDQYLHPIISDE